MEEEFAKIIASVGEDLSREGLIDTPKRAAKAFKFLNNGYEKTLEEVYQALEKVGYYRTWRKPR
jgi:GTP cyclohydrolase I